MEQNDKKYLSEYKREIDLQLLINNDFTLFEITEKSQKLEPIIYTEKYLIYSKSFYNKKLLSNENHVSIHLINQTSKYYLTDYKVSAIFLANEILLLGFQNGMVGIISLVERSFTKEDFEDDKFFSDVLSRNIKYFKNEKNPNERVESICVEDELVFIFNNSSVSICTFNFQNMDLKFVESKCILFTQPENDQFIRYSINPLNKKVVLWNSQGVLPIKNILKDTSLQLNYSSLDSISYVYMGSNKLLWIGCDNGTFAIIHKNEKTPFFKSSLTGSRIIFITPLMYKLKNSKDNVLRFVESSNFVILITADLKINIWEIAQNYSMTKVTEINLINFLVKLNKDAKDFSPSAVTILDQL